MSNSEHVMYVISHSDAEQHSRCEWAHHYSYGYNITPKQQAEHLQLGHSFHEIIAGYYRGLRDGENYDDSVDAGLLIHQQQVKDKKYDMTVLGTVIELYNKYVEYYNPDEWEILWVEEYMEYQVTDNLILNGEIDLVVRAKTGKLYGQIGVVDHKTCYNFMTNKEIGTHSQIPKYVFALNRMKIFDQKITFGILNQIRWREVKNIDKLFSRIVLTEQNNMSEVKQANFINEYIKQANRIIPKRNLPDPYFWKDSSNRTTIKDICKYCDFQSLCVEELEGKNSDLTRRVYFSVKDLSYRQNRTRVNGKPRLS